MKHGLVVALLILARPAMAQAEEPPSGTWNFTATLDGRPIGHHRFMVSGSSGDRMVESRADFTVRMLGISVYRYQHQAHERWQEDCLRELIADTDDDGKRQQVTQRFEAECLMSFAYWHPRLVAQKRLINPQTGKVELAQIEPLGEQPVTVRGEPVRARGWRLVAGSQRIVVWYAADSGRWVGLDADAKGGRKLAYRLAEGDSP